MTDYSQELKLAKEAAYEAADVIRTIQKKKDFNISYKGRNDLVTDADVAAEEKILQVIAGQFPDDQVLAEESAQKNKTLPDGRIWLVDPIDGTTNFAHGFPVYCVSIGLWQNGQPKAGVVLEVNTGELFEASIGDGAYCNGQRLSVSPIDHLNKAMIGTGFPYNDLSLEENYIKYFQFLVQNAQAVRRPGAASYDLCCVAAGRFDGFYEYSLKPWDVGAGALIVQEAGGRVTDWEGGNNWLMGERLIAGNPEIQRILLQTIQKHFEKEELTKAGNS